MVDRPRMADQSSVLPLVSVCLPTFNRASSLPRAIESALAQTYPSIELVISDNASTDQTEAICRRYAHSDTRVRYERKPTNIGALANFVDVLERSSGEFFLWLGDDDWIDASYIECCMSRLLSDPGLAVAGGTASNYSGGKLAYIARPINLVHATPLRRVLSYYYQVGDNGIFYGVIRRSCASRATISRVMGWDWLFMASLAFQGRIVTCDDVHVHRALAGASQSHAKMASLLGISRLHATFPQTSIAIAAAGDMLRPGAVFESRPMPARLAFAALVFLQIIAAKGLIQNTKSIVVRLLRRLIGEPSYRKLRGLFRR